MSMRHLLDAKHYYAEETLHLERTHLFGRVWNFFGFAQMLSERGSYIARTVGGVPI